MTDINISLPENEGRKIRTQVVLTDSLKKQIQVRIRLTGESVSQYLRKAAWQRLKKEKHLNQELDKISRRLIGSISLKNHPQWQSKKKLLDWQKKIRGEWEQRIS